MDGLVSVCHFCEQHGPSVVFCTQTHQQLPSDDQLQLACERSSVNSDECAACRAFSMEKGCLVTESSSVCYVSSRVPLSDGVASLLHRTCVRSLSCEVCPGGEGCIYFGDDVRGHALSYIFSLRDLQARGLKRWFSLVVLVKERAYLLSAWPFLARHLQQIVQLLQERALQIFNKEGGSNRRVQTELPHRQKTSVRGLPELVAAPAIWHRLHSAFVWLMAASGARIVEVIAPACDLFASATISSDFVDSKTDFVKKGSVDSAVDVARDVDDLEMEEKLDLNRKNEKGESARSEKGTVDDGSKMKENSSKKETAEKNEIGNFDGRESREKLNDNTQKRLIFDSSLPQDESQFEPFSKVKTLESGNDPVFSGNNIELKPFDTLPNVDEFSENVKSTPVASACHSSRDYKSENLGQHLTDNTPHSHIRDPSPTTEAEVLTLRKLRELLGADQFGILLQHLLLGFPLLIRCAQDKSAVKVASSLARALKNILPYFLHSLMSVTTKIDNFDETKPAHSDQLRNMASDSQKKASHETEHRKLSQSGNFRESKTPSSTPATANYFRLPSSPSIEAYDALEIDTLVLVVRARTQATPIGTRESSSSMSRNTSYASLPRDSSGIHSSNFQSSTFRANHKFDSSSRARTAYNSSTSSELDREAWKFQQFMKQFKFQLEDVSGRSYFGSSAVAFASDALHRHSCTLVRTITSACTNSALRDDTLHLMVHNAILSWCSKAKLWDNLLAEQRPNAANVATCKSSLSSTAADRPASPKPKTSFGFSLSSPQWPKFLTSSRSKKQSEPNSQKRDKHCDRYEVVGLYPSLCESFALEEGNSSAETSKFEEKRSHNSSTSITISSGDRSSKSSTPSNSAAVGGHQPSVLSRFSETNPNSSEHESTAKGLKNSSTATSSAFHLSEPSSSSSLLKSETIKTKPDSQSRRVNKLYPSISEEEISLPNIYGVHEAHTQASDSELSIHPVPSQGSLVSSGMGQNILSPETLDPASLTSLTSLSLAVGLPESHLQKILLAVGASEVDVPLLQCWAFHLRCNSLAVGSQQTKVAV